MVNRQQLTVAETALVQIFDRRADAYKLAEQQRLDELRLVNEQVALMINPGATAATVATDIGEGKSGDSIEGMAVEGRAEMDAIAVAGESGDKDEVKNRDEEATTVVGEEPDRYKDLSKAAASASSRNQEKLLAKSAAKRKYDITAGPEQASSTMRKPDGSERRAVKKMKKKVSVDEEDDIVDTEKVSSMLDKNCYISTDTWDPKEVTENASFALSRFGVNEEDEEGADDEGAEEDYLLKYPQTIVVRLQVPKDARRWSLNVCPKDHKNLSDVFLHVNPRYKKGKLHLNDKQGTWGRPQEVDLKQPKQGNKAGGDGLLSKDVELVIAITRKAFCVYANGMCAGIFPHRRDLRKHTELALVLGRTDDNGVVENAVFNSVWWGYLNPRINYNKLMSKDQKEFLNTLLTFEERQREREGASSDGAQTASVGGVVQEEPSLRTLEVSGLPPHSDPKEIQHVEEVLYDIFEDFEPESVQITAGHGNGYVRLPSLENTLDALQELQGVGIEAEGKSFVLQLKRLDWT